MLRPVQYQTNTPYLRATLKPLPQAIILLHIIDMVEEVLLLLSAGSKIQLRIKAGAPTPDTALLWHQRMLPLCELFKGPPWNLTIPALSRATSKDQSS